MHTKIKTLVLFLLSVCLVILLLSVFISQNTVLHLLKNTQDNQKQLSLDVGLIERKIDFLQDKVYQDRINKFLQNNNIHYSTTLYDGEIAQLNYGKYRIDTSDGFNSTIIYNFFVCFPNTEPCLETKEEDQPTISFKNIEIITNYTVEKLKPAAAKHPIYVIKVETDLLNHLYFFVPEFDDSSNNLYYRLINPITDQGWLRQYEGEKKTKFITVGDEDITLELEIIPIHYQVYSQNYLIVISLTDSDGYKLEFKRI